MKDHFYIQIFCFFLSSAVFAQNNRFVTSGTIEFEKSINMHAIIRKSYNGKNAESMNLALDNYRAKNAQFKVLKSVLSFANNKMLFSPVRDNDSEQFYYYNSRPIIDQNNIVYTDLQLAKTVQQKTVLDETFLVKDNMKRINWKITDETREIAGYLCRRANAIILDSIYIVAFYTGQIPVSGGPESFSGLPGMILGVALPYEHLTWFATKVVPFSLTTEIVEPKSAKAKEIDNNQLKTILLSRFTDLGSVGLAVYLKGFML